MLDPSELQSIKQRFGIIGNSPRLNHAVAIAAQVAPTDMSVLITGESGSGKESFSKIIHNRSVRKHGQFIAINCGAIPEGTIDSELFGHEKGAFTGAMDARKGYFEVTHGGTIFLDEIGEMPIGTQARLLRVLENGEFIKVGSSKVLKSDVRVVAATNVNLLEAVEKGTFREDLYYRLSSVPIHIPPLRERGNDIDLLFRKFAADYSEKYRTKPISLTEDAKEVLLKYRFPGNIRELKNLVERISTLEIESREIDSDKLRSYLPPSTSNLPALYARSGESEKFSERDILYKILFEMRHDMTELKKLVHQVLQNENYGSNILEQHQDFFNGVEDEIKETEESFKTANEIANNRYLLANPNKNNDDDTTYELANIEDITHEAEENDDLSLEKKEKEMIIRALKKNDRKRKYAAKDLGISERTLYRKIKQYEIE
ncbi:transcriptional regulator with PAS, ATPase and Fis domain [Catalinimonas alkaloidigena]|uniref:sigma-54 interaction domain-containing protein n=1 Tax=Catalinimonas alkaloidigena TaxID=1075417 RepID=UPI0024054DAE|nr:sigma 54-interacting transcriptional regulator [Catalinimonas alkaloidigena]MDF9797532.1 transcriptional regulator with PAS, ATPase and Fis domain [Catalinimonas alkaloidigena]